MEATIFSFFDDATAARQAASSLSRLGLAESQMRVIHDRSDLSQGELDLVLTDASNALLGGALRGATVGGIAGALLFGPLGLLGGGALTAAAFGVAAGGAYGALGGGIVGSAVPDRSLGQWLDELPAEGALLELRIDDAREAEIVENLLSEHLDASREPLTYVDTDT